MQKKANLRNATGVDTWKFDKKVDLASLKSDIDQLYTDRLETTPVNLAKTEVVKKTRYN